MLITEKALLKRIGESLEKARIVRKLSQQELAERASVSRQTISNIEKGKPSVSLVSVIWALSLDENLLKALSQEEDKLGRSLAFGSLPSRVVGKRHLNDDSGEF